MRKGGSTDPLSAVGDPGLGVEKDPTGEHSEGLIDVTAKSRQHVWESAKRSALCFASVTRAPRLLNDDDAGERQGASRRGQAEGCEG